MWDIDTGVATMATFQRAMATNRFDHNTFSRRVLFTPKSQTANPTTFMEAFKLIWLGNSANYSRSALPLDPSGVFIPGLSLSQVPPPPSMTKTYGWSWLRQAVCLRHGGKFSLKPLTFGHFL